MSPQILVNSLCLNAHSEKYLKCESTRCFQQQRDYFVDTSTRPTIHPPRARDLVPREERETAFSDYTTDIPPEYLPTSSEEEEDNDEDYYDDGY